MATVIPIKHYTGEGFKGEKVITIFSFCLIIVSLVSAVVSIRTNVLQHKQIILQMKESENLRKLKEEEESKKSKS